MRKVGGVAAIIAGVALLGWLGYAVLIQKEWPRRAIGATIGGIALVGWGLKLVFDEE